MRLEFPRQIFEKKAEISSFTKPRLVAAELFHADGQTDMTKLIVAFCNFPNATKKIVLGVPPGKKKSWGAEIQRVALTVGVTCVNLFRDCVLCSHLRVSH